METVGATTVWTRQTALGEKRDLWSAMKRGFRGRCPRCGEGKLFRAFLKVGNNCAACGLDFTPHRADDLPAYLPLTLVLSLALLQPVKGAVVGLQWALRMHGFDENTPSDEISPG